MKHKWLLLFFLVLSHHILCSAQNGKLVRKTKASAGHKTAKTPHQGPESRNAHAKRTETTSTTEAPQSPPLTHDEMLELLTAHGYHVKNFTDGPPLAFMGDTAYYPEQVLRSLPSVADRSNIQNTRLWVDATWVQQVWYYFDVQTQADVAIFEQAVKTWSDSTCIQFHRGQRGACTEDRGHGAVCVGNFDGCWSMVGNSYVNSWTRSSQKMSVQLRGCEMVAAAHEFGHALGLQHQQARPDRSQHIWVNYENLDIKPTGQLDNNVKQAWFQASMCAKDQTVDVPSPYDFLSLMQYGASDFAAEDGRIVYVARDSHHQYMMDYHRSAGIAQTHYDKLVINTAYKCTVYWHNTCSENGHAVPKCVNGGFLAKSCKCECPDGFSGSACSTKAGTLYPVQDRAKVMLDITEPGTIDLADKGMNIEDHGYILRDFVFYQFITVVVNTGHPRELANIRVHQPFKAVASVMAPRGSQDLLMENIATADCQRSGFFYWGSAEFNKIRTECISSVLNNEVPGQQLMLRGRNRTLSVVVIGFLGRLYEDPTVTMRAVEFKFEVEFGVNAAKQLRQFRTRGDDHGPLSDLGTEGGSIGAGAIVGIVVGVVVVWAAVGLAVAWKLGKLPRR